MQGFPLQFFPKTALLNPHLFAPGGRNQGYSGARLSIEYRHDCPRPLGRGRRPEAGRGGAGETCESLRETGEGETPSPSAPPPMVIAPTVHGMRACPRKRSSRGQAGSGTSLSRVRMKIRTGFQPSPKILLLFSAPGRKERRGASPGSPDFRKRHVGVDVLEACLVAPLHRGEALE